MARPNSLDDRKRLAVMILHRNGWRPDELALLFDVSDDTIRRAVEAAYREAGKVRRAQELIPESVR